ncbi:MAG: SMP-30/gluconolactonase/LRE family protein [Anaerolineales bacterium]
MPNTFNCPNCGAPLDYHGGDPIIRCPYCNTSVVVPDNLRATPSFSSQPHNFTLSGMGDMGALIQKARRIKDVKDLAQSGKLDEAISLYREITDSSHSEAEAAVQALAQGRPITLTNFSAADVAAQVRQYVAAPVIQVQTPVAKTSNRTGCLVGCFIVALTLFILAVTLIPIFAGSILSGDQNMPAIVQTILPAVSTSMPALPHGFAQQELSFGGEGTGPGLFTDPRAIAVDPTSGNIYVADYEGGRVQAFDAQGKFITQWQVGDRKSIITGMTADHKGNVFVVTTSTIYRYDGSTGNVLGQIKADDTVTYHYDDITASADGTLYAVGGGETVVHMDINGKIISTIPNAVSTVSGDSELDSKIAVDGENNVYLLGTFNNAVFKFGPSGKYLNKFGSDGDQPGQFRAPDTIAVDGQGNVYVSDFKGIQVFDKDGRYVDVISLDGACFGMAFDDQGKLYITTNVNKIIRFAISKK